jgi:hypothetical protein
MVQNPKPDGLISPKVAAVPEQQSEREASEDESSADQPGSSQGQIGSRSVSLANGEAKPDAERKSKEVVAEQYRAPEAKAETQTEARISSR